MRAHLRKHNESVEWDVVTEGVQGGCEEGGSSSVETVSDDAVKFVLTEEDIFNNGSGVDEVSCESGDEPGIE